MRARFHAAQRAHVSSLANGHTNGTASACKELGTIYHAVEPLIESSADAEAIADCLTALVMLTRSRSIVEVRTLLLQFAALPNQRIRVEPMSSNPPPPHPGDAND